MKLSEWARANGVSRQSATRWFHAGALPVPARQLATGTILVDEPERRPGGLAIYARVSSGDQRGDLDRQVARLVTHLTTAGLAPTRVVSGVGSGLNGHRARLLGLLGDASVGTIVVAHRHRPARLVSSTSKPPWWPRAAGWSWSTTPRSTTTWCGTWWRFSPASALARMAGARPKRRAELALAAAGKAVA